MANSLIVVDIGGTNTRVALSPWPLTRSSIFDLTEIATFRTAMSYDAQMESLAVRLAEASARAGADTPDSGRVVGVGAAFGGRMTRDGASVAVAPNLRDYEGRPLARDLAERANVSNSASRQGLVRVAHDTVCGLLGEKNYGALVGQERCAYLTISTGLGAAIHLAGARSQSGVYVSIEMGHQLLDGSTRQCLCGQIGCLETYVGGRQLEQYHGAPLEKLDDLAVWGTMAEKLALGVINLAQLTRVEVIAVGGAIAFAHPALLDALQARVNDMLRGMALEIVPAALADRAPLVGAAKLLAIPARSFIN
jgi:glucokinase